MRKFLLAIIFATFLAAPALADTYQTYPGSSLSGIWDLSTSSLYAIGINGSTAKTIIPNAATGNLWSGTNNFTGTFKIGGTTETFPTSGLIVGTTDTQTLSGKTLTSPTLNTPIVNTSLTLSIGTAAPLLVTTASLQNGAASSTGTLTNAPAVGNPTKWIPINDNGTTRYIPAW